MYGILFFCFIDALESFRFSQKVLNRFSKDFTNGNYGRSPVCLHTPLVSFNLTPISKGFEKVCLGDFWTQFMDFLRFLKNYLTKSKILALMDGIGCGKLPCISGSAQSIFTQKHMALKIVNFKIFDHFWNF